MRERRHGQLAQDQGAEDSGKSQQATETLGTDYKPSRPMQRSKRRSSSSTWSSETRSVRIITSFFASMCAKFESDRDTISLADAPRSLAHTYFEATQAHSYGQLQRLDKPKQSRPSTNACCVRYERYKLCSSVQSIPQSRTPPFPTPEPPPIPQFPTTRWDSCVTRWALTTKNNKSPGPPISP